MDDVKKDCVCQALWFTGLFLGLLRIAPYFKFIRPLWGSSGLDAMLGWGRESFDDCITVDTCGLGSVQQKEAMLRRT